MVTRTQSRTDLSVWDLPAAGTPSAPKTFTGRYDEVEDFLHDFHNMAEQYNLTKEQRFARISRYVNRKTQRIIDGIHGYYTKDWKKFEEDMLRMFEADKAKKRCVVDDLEKFVDEWQERRIDSIADFRKYERRFARLGGWLHSQELIDDTKYAKLFWKGLHQRTRKKLKHRILTVQSHIDITIPFPMKVIQETAEFVYDTRAFDEEYANSHSNSDSDSDDEESQSDSD